MMRTDGEREAGPEAVFYRRLWQRSRATDAPEDEAARFLDLAAFADRRLDADEEDRIAALLAVDPDAAADVEAARALDGVVQQSAGLNRVVARACALVRDVPASRRAVALSASQRRRNLMQGLARWGSIAAAIAMACWLGFAMGSDASLAISDPRRLGDASFLPELFDPATGFLRDFGEDLRT